MLCQFEDEQGEVDAIMCGKSGNYCLSDQWCTNPSNVKLSYWTSTTYTKNLNCDSDGKLILYLGIFSNVYYNFSHYISSS